MNLVDAAHEGAVLAAALALAAIGLVLQCMAWAPRIGLFSSVLATLLRTAWLAPIFLAFFPQTTSEELPRSMQLKPVHVLLDDSESMGFAYADGDSPKQQSVRLIKDLEEGCARYGCALRLTRFSELDQEVRQGYTPLSSVLDSWMYKIGPEPWLLLTDGADQMPTEPWSASLRRVGAPLPARAKAEATNLSAESEAATRGLIVGFAPRGRDNIWIKDTNVPPFSFEDRPLTFDVRLRRSHQDLAAELVQVQVLTGEQALATVNAQFQKGESETEVAVAVPPMPRGQHLLSIRALPTAGETMLWDNTAHAQIEVMPNTVGVLHLLGSPSWDGRFLRRYLKSEPKYDLISFFILRDPWDSQQVNERELSLIPFPVERLFREELPNFRVVVLQNFTLFQFLLPEYQQNLVRFVMDGGGLLFLGGPRALMSSDLSSSPLKQILPFNVDEDSLQSMPLFGFGDDMVAPSSDDKGPAYDGELAFSVEFADPPAEKRALANVYDDWEALHGPLTAWRGGKGLHHMERMQFKEDKVTPLLHAKTAKGRMPLAVASYPGKGRALWVFTDSLWRLAMSGKDHGSRDNYNRFLQGAMTWLLRQDLRKPLVAKGFHIAGGRGKARTFRVAIQGPAARYYEASNDWRLSVCSVQVPTDKVNAQRIGADEWELQGSMPVNLAGGERCTLSIEGQHPAFGSVKAEITAIEPQVFRDQDLDATPKKLEELAKLTEASLVLPPKDAGRELETWLAKITGTDGVALPARYKTESDHFWMFSKPWFWLLLACLPLEVLVRRWQHLIGGGGARRAAATKAKSS